MANDFSISDEEQAARMAALKDALKMNVVQHHIYHNAFIKFSILDRLRILIGMPVNVEVKIQTNDENVVVLATKTDVWVNKIFPKKARMEGGLQSISQSKVESPIAGEELSEFDPVYIKNGNTFKS